MNRTLVLIAGFLTLVGFIVSVTGDLGDLYTVTTSGIHVISHTLSLLWLLTVMFSFAGVFTGNSKDKGRETM